MKDIKNNYAKYFIIEERWEKYGFGNVIKEEKKI
jgi:hypothetical protein